MELISSKRPNEFLSRQVDKYFLLIIIIFAVVVGTIGFLLGTNSKINLEVHTVNLTLIILGILGIFLLIGVSRILKDFVMGIRGEENVCLELKFKLPQGYFGFQNLNPYKKGDVDITVVGPTGVFAIEVKNFSKTSVIKDGNLFVGDYNCNSKINKAKLHTINLHRYLFKRGVNHWIFPVFAIVGKAEFNSSKLNNIDICHSRYIVSFITSKQNILSQEEINKIVNILSNL